MSPVLGASIAGIGWLADRELSRLLSALSEGGEEARFAGGAVRDALIGRPVSDIDIATTTLPAEIRRRAEAAGFRAIPTGEEHGTITVIVEGRPVEVTTLRADVETDGRHAVVRFGRDWQADAERRDFTINALYAEADGRVVDLVGGLADLREGRLRFIGSAEDRIREDFLRILRFFRFFAWYGGGRPDADGLKACARLKDGLARLSAERVWAELRKLLAAPDPSRSLLWMRQAGVLTAVLPETEKWGIDAIHGLVAAEKELGWKPDPMMRLVAMLPPDRARMPALSERLRLSNQERETLENWAGTAPFSSDDEEAALGLRLYREDRHAVLWRLRLDAVALRSAGRMAEADALLRLLARAEGWTRPRFPVSGQDLLAEGMAEGPALGETLRSLEERWLDSGFRLTREELLFLARMSG